MKANNHDTDDRCIRTCCRGSVSNFALPLHVLIQTSPAQAELSFDLQRKDRPKSRAARLQAYSRPPSSPIYQFLDCYIRGLKDHQLTTIENVSDIIAQVFVFVLVPCCLSTFACEDEYRLKRAYCTEASLRTLLVTMFSLAAEHPVLAALGVLFVGWVARFLWKGYQVRKTFHDQVSRYHLDSHLCGMT
jgi:hypothetical protein